MHRPAAATVTAGRVLRLAHCGAIVARVRSGALGRVVSAAGPAQRGRGAGLGLPRLRRPTPARSSSARRLTGTKRTGKHSAPSRWSARGVGPPRFVRRPRAAIRPRPGWGFVAEYFEAAASEIERCRTSSGRLSYRRSLPRVPRACTSASGRSPSPQECGRRTRTRTGSARASARPQTVRSHRPPRAVSRARSGPSC